jgi:hypothetical protein
MRNVLAPAFLMIAAEKHAACHRCIPRRDGGDREEARIPASTHREDPVPRCATI